MRSSLPAAAQFDPVDPTGQSFPAEIPAPPIETHQQELTHLYEEYAHRLRRYAWSLTGNPQLAEELTQEAFLRYLLRRREGEHIDCPRAWLFRVLRNRTIDYLKRAAENMEISDDALALIADPRQNPEHSRHLADTLRLIRSSLGRRELDCLRLRAAGLSYTEIADALGVRAGTVGAMLNKATRKLKSALVSCSGRN
jgi:RNA polymerase sigma-70 factor (ECF subfamily)